MIIMIWNWFKESNRRLLQRKNENELVNLPTKKKKEEAKIVGKSLT